MASDPLSKDPTVRDLDQLYSQAKTGRSWLDPIWLMNLAFYNNDQWLAFNGRNLFQPSLRPNRITVVDNRITPAVRTEVAKMTKQRPVLTVTPSSADDENVNAANLGEQVMRYLWGHLNCQEITVKALEWSRICGAGFVKAYWDSTLGESTEVLVGPTNNVLTDAQNQPMRPGQVDPGQLASSMGLPEGAVRVKAVSRGEIRLEARSPFQMFPDPLCDTFDEAEWLIEESVKSREYVRRRYDVDLEPDTPANPGMVEVKMASFAPGGSPYKGIKLREFWAKPSSKYPGGARIVWAQGKVLAQDKPFDPQPYVMFSSIPVPGRLWPSSIVEHLRGPQVELNKVKSQMAENRNRLGNPTLLANAQAVKDPEKFASQISTPGGIAWIDSVYGPDAIPKYLDAPPLPDYVVEEIPRIIESIQDISGQHEVTSAQVPPGVTAASAITLLQEADDTRLGPGITDYERQHSKLGEKILKLVANFYTDQRVIRIAGDDGAWQIQDFRGADLKGNTQVQVQTGSAFPQTKAGKQAAMTDLLRMIAQMGMPMDPKMLGQFLKDWEIGGADRLIEMFSRDDQQVNRENMQLARGTPLPINDYDDDDAHVEGHTTYQKSSHYQSLSPQVKHLFSVHVGAHRERLQQIHQQQLQMQAQMAGQVPPNLSQAAFQDEHELSQLQGHTQMQMDVAQAQQRQGASAQQQGFDQAAAEQKQRQGEEEHRQRLHHQESRHQLELQRMEEERQRQREVHEAKLTELAQRRQQARQQSQRPSPDKKAA